MFQVTVQAEPIYIAADPSEPKEIINLGGGKAFHKATKPVAATDTELAAGTAVTITEGRYFISASRTELGVRSMNAAGFSGGIALASALPGAYVGGWPPASATTGTDTTPAEKKLFVGSMFLPVNKVIKGIGFLVGSVGGTNKAVVGLFDSAGKLLGKSSETTEGTLVGTAAEMQEINLAAAVAAAGPAIYFVGITMNGNTARLRTIPKNTAGSNVFGKEVTIAAKNVLADIAAPTAMEADKAPIAWVF
jgi:hypothetical protein